MLEMPRIASSRIDTKRDILETTAAVVGAALLVETGKLVRR